MFTISLILSSAKILNPSFNLNANKHFKKPQSEPKQLDDSNETESDEKSSVSTDRRYEIEPVSTLFGAVQQGCRTVEENVEDCNIFLIRIVGSAC